MRGLYLPSLLLLCLVAGWDDSLGPPELSVAIVKLSAPRQYLDALGDTIRLAVQIVNKQGKPVPEEVLTYSSEDTNVVTVNADRLVTARGNGATWIRATARNGISDRIGVEVIQRPARVIPARDTIRFRALGDTLSAEAAVVDSLGSPIEGLPGDLIVADTAIVVPVSASGGKLRIVSRANGLTTADFHLLGLTGSVVVVVDQEPAKLTASVISPSPVVTLEARRPATAALSWGGSER